MVRSHAGMSRLAALQAIGQSHNALMFDGWFDYKVCEFEIATQWINQIGCSEVTQSLVDMEQLLCEASRVPGLNQQDARYTAAYTVLNGESGVWSRSVLVVGEACTRAVEYTNRVNQGLKDLMQEAGRPSKVNPPAIKPPRSNIIPTEFLVAGGIVLGLGALFYLGPAIKTLTPKK